MKVAVDLRATVFDSADPESSPEVDGNFHAPSASSE
jgi:hypothetical protein